MGKDEMADMVNYGADAIFTVGSNVNDKDIDALIEDGLQRSNNAALTAEKKIGEKGVVSLLYHFQILKLFSYEKKSNYIRNNRPRRKLPR